MVTKFEPLKGGNHLPNSPRIVTRTENESLSSNFPWSWVYTNFVDTCKLQSHDGPNRG